MLGSESWELRVEIVRKIPLVGTDVNICVVVVGTTRGPYERHDNALVSLSGVVKSNVSSARAFKTNIPANDEIELFSLSSVPI